MTIQPGERVRLSSGGPVMTVERVDAAGEARCSWFEGKTRKKKRQGRFRTAALERIPKRPGGAIGFVF